MNRSTPLWSVISGSLVKTLVGYWPIALLFLLWQVWVMVMSYSAIVMPPPTAVLWDIVTNSNIYLHHTLMTLSTALLGLVGGMLLGGMLASLSWSSKVASGLLTPVTVMFSSVPVVALIPIIARLLGYDASTVIAVAVIITFFPSFVFMTAGLRALPNGSDGLFRVLGASRWSYFLHLALPSAMPSLAVALRLASSQAILAAMVAEFLMGTSGLGYLFAITMADFSTERAFGASLVTTFISLALFLIASRIEVRVKKRFA
ncbi:ABC transporter permease subunit [Halomonas sp. PA5]|nr:ABC transporter permease subunit [Halomonas sp. PA5]